MNLHSLSRVQTSMCWKQVRLRWLQERDANTKYFNCVLTSRRRQNTIQLLQVDNVQVEGVQNIRSAIFTNFSSHFRRMDVVRPGVDNLPFYRLSMVVVGNLIKPFYFG